MTEEHVIPEQVGGKLTLFFLCKGCNSDLGSEVEGAVKKDPSIRIAVDRLAEKIPALAKAMRHGQEFVGQGPLGEIRGTVKNGAFKMAAARGPKGSLDLDLRESRKNIRHRLKKRGLDAAALDEAMARFDTAPLDVPVALPGGIGIIQRQVSLTLAPVLSGPLLDERVLLKIAYESLALHIGNDIYSDVPALNELRAAIWDGKARTDFHEIQYWMSRDYTPVHGIAFIGLPYAGVTICLFDWLRYRVHLKRIAVNPPNWGYSHRLDTGEEGWAPLTDETLLQKLQQRY
jgi:hypothetical protein